MVPAIHHPLQCARPGIGFVSDADRGGAEATRLALLEEAAAADAVLVPAHFPTSPAGRLAAEPGGGWRFLPETPATG